MEALLLSKGLFPSKYLQDTVEFILNTQLADGNIPWFKGGKTDPWNLVEAAMGLSISAQYQHAEQAYAWLAQQQLEDGSWWAGYQGNQPVNKDHRETNFIAYLATGVWHHYLCTGRQEFLQDFYPVVDRAINFVLRYQSPTGEIYWAVDKEGKAKKDALITGCCSILKSLECAICIAATLGEEKPDWQLAHEQLKQALRHHPELFDRTWESKSRYSMDWFYPILAGAFAGREAKTRLQNKWNSFVKKSLGCRCVSDEPWVTVAESCELTLALLATGEHAKAVTLYSWLHRWKDTDGGYWTGYQFVEDIIWPEEKTTWTAGAVILAADALTQYSPAANLFLQSFMPSVSKSFQKLSNTPQHAQRIDRRQYLKKT